MKKLLLIILLINSTFCFSQIQIGSDIVGDNFLDSFGESVSMSGDGNIVVIGATGSDVNGGGSGQVKVFENVNGTCYYLLRKYTGISYRKIGEDFKQTKRAILYNYQKCEDMLSIPTYYKEFAVRFKILEDHVINFIAKLK